jgi:hypothetical protein
VQRWEYLSVELAWDEATGEWDADGEHAAEELGHVLAQYGVQGWEMVGFAPDRWMTAVVPGRGLGADVAGGPWEVQVYRAVFKRPAAGAAGV